MTTTRQGNSNADAGPVKQWEVFSRNSVFEKFGRGIDEVVYTLPNGQHDTFYIKAEKPTACVLALTADESVVMVRQFRPGPGEVLLELPGGYIDDDEGPVDAMRRELREETGYDGAIEMVTTAFDDAYSTLTRTCFVARDCKKVSQPSPDSTEYLEVVEVPLHVFREVLRSGRMTDIEVGYLGLDHLGLLA